VSRALTSLIGADELGLVRRFKAYYSRYQRNRDLITVGAYAAGSDALLDRAIALQPAMEAFLQQNLHEKALYTESIARMKALVGPAGDH
jgi:flagellum-specific ATP synthase